MSKRRVSRLSRDKKGVSHERQVGSRPRGAEADPRPVGGPPEAARSSQAPSGSGQAPTTAGRPPSWWERFPGRRDFELEELARVGLEPEVIAGERLVVRVKISFEGDRHTAEVRFPDLYPFTRCEVIAPTLQLRKHQNPFGHNLCLLDRSTAAWEVSDTAAGLITRQLPMVEEAIRDREPRPDIEVPQAEPVSAYFEGSAEPGSVILVPREAARLPAGYKKGTLQVILRYEGARVRGVITAVDDITSTTIPKGVRAVFGGESRAIRWGRFDGPPPSPATAIQEFINRGTVQLPSLRSGEEDLSAVAFSEEVAYGQPPELTWLLIHWRMSAGQLSGHLVRTERFAAEEQALRIPHIAALATKRIVLFGLGGVGAPLAHELLQMRTGELRVIDHDLVRVGNAVRWPLGFEAAGLSKVQAFSQFAQRHYPETAVVTMQWRIGSSALDAQSPDEGQLMSQALDGADLVIDATAELGLQYLLTEAARERGLPIITAEGRAGGYGGLVARYRANRGGCYVCLKLHQQDGRFIVPDDASGRFVQPRGCADPTFTGAVFDLVPISSLAARLAAQTLVASAAFPDAGYDLALLYNHDPAGGAVPRWEHHQIEPHPECRRCGSPVS